MINREILSPQCDPMGAAILDYEMLGSAATLRVLSSMFDEDEMPVPHLFRTYRDMPPLEQKALQMACGKVLDVGAGAGCHALELQHKGYDVKAIDISPLSCEAMKHRGIESVQCINLFDDRLDTQYDTILMLMNGTGIAGKIANLPMLLERLKELLCEGGQVLIDSSDIRYVYQNEDGSLDIDLNGPYYGEVDYQMVYKDTQGNPFDWLYVDYPLLKTIAEASGMKCEHVKEGTHFDYLAKLTL